MVVFDAAILTLLICDNADPPLDHATGRPLEHARARVELLVQTLHKSGTKILIPTPVLSEVLVQSGSDGLRYVETLQKSAVFRLEPFDTRAAIELAEMTREALDVGDKRSSVTAPWQLIKLDRQVVSIARVARATTLYTDDDKLSKFARMAKLDVISVHQLPVPVPDAQTNMIAALESAITERPDDAELEEFTTNEAENEDALGAEDFGGAIKPVSPSGS